MAVLIWLGYSPIRSGLHLELLHSLTCCRNNKTITGRIVRHIRSSPFSQLGFCPRVSFAQSKDICGKRRCNFFLFWFVIKRLGRIWLHRKHTAYLQQVFGTFGRKIVDIRGLPVMVPCQHRRRSCLCEYIMQLNANVN